MTQTRTSGLNVARSPWLFLLLPLLLVLLLAGGLGQLRFNVDYRVFFSPDNPQLVAFNHLQDNFSASEKLLLVYTPSSCFGRSRPPDTPALKAATCTNAYDCRQVITFSP